MKQIAHDANSNSPPGLRQAQLGENIRRLREARKLRQIDVARHVGLSVSQFSRLESGEKRCYVDVLLGIAEALEVDVSALLVSEGMAADMDRAACAVRDGGQRGGLALLALAGEMIQRP